MRLDEFLVPFDEAPLEQRLARVEKCREARQGALYGHKRKKEAKSERKVSRGNSKGVSTRGRRAGGEGSESDQGEP